MIVGGVLVLAVLGQPGASIRLLYSSSTPPYRFCSWRSPRGWWADGAHADGIDPGGGGEHAGVRRLLCMEGRARPVSPAHSVRATTGAAPAPRREMPRSTRALANETMPPPNRPPARIQATRAQRIAMLLGFAVAARLALQLFALVPCRLLGSPTSSTRPTRAGAPRFIAASLLILALISAAAPPFARCSIRSHLGPQFGRPQGPNSAIRVPAAALGQGCSPTCSSFGSVVDDKLRDLVSGQAGHAELHRLLAVAPDRHRLRDLQRAHARGRHAGGGLLPAARLAAGYHHGPFRLPHRYAEVIRAQAREVDRILSAWVRGQALCCLILALYSPRR